MLKSWFRLKLCGHASLDNLFIVPCSHSSRHYFTNKIFFKISWWSLDGLAIIGRLAIIGWAGDRRLGWRSSDELAIIGSVSDHWIRWWYHRIGWQPSDQLVDWSSDQIVIIGSVGDHRIKWWSLNRLVAFWSAGWSPVYNIVSDSMPINHGAFNHWTDRTSLANSVDQLSTFLHPRGKARSSDLQYRKKRLHKLHYLRIFLSHTRGYNKKILGNDKAGKKWTCRSG